MKRLSVWGLACLGLACLAITAIAGTAHAEPIKIRFILDWKAQGPGAWYYFARDKGYFQAEGLDVTIDQGDGSAAAVSHIMTGAYDAGFGDINAVIQNAAQRPGEQPVLVYMLYNRAPYALIVKADGPIKTLKDMEGRTLAAPAGSATERMFKPLALKNGVDASTVKILNAAPNLIEQLLVNGQADAIAQFSLTSYMNFLAMKKSPETDFRWFFYSENGLDLYSNGILVSQKLLKEKPEAVRGLVKALNRAILEVAANPDEGIAVLKKVEPLTNVDLEKQRLVYTVDHQLRTDEVARLGLGDLDDTRLQAAIKTVSEAYALPRTPSLDEVFSRAFLPPKADRALPGR
ncbi:ABC transporter substrate-binding protein [Bradyrhizobium sp.]|jgi:NitT/TauT family transport system substrate-binding protein|uniref:ABC transporter substrate-binding protein n=1 Tax=Bradyrhizobium sp. TaxID=376 RepID=UPI003D0A3953